MFETVDWVFPNINNCPIDWCDISFSSRDLAFDHFREFHADSSMICKRCHEFFSANDAQILFEHNQIQYLNESSKKLEPICRNCLPNKNANMSKQYGVGMSLFHGDQIEFEQQVCKISAYFNFKSVFHCAFRSKFQSDDDFSGTTDYDVELGESTDFDTVTWHFPDTKECPLKQCTLQFSHRNVALLHFCMKHAKETTICTVCDELFSAENSQDLLQHYKDLHPNEPQPTLKLVSNFFFNNGNFKL